MDFDTYQTQTESTAKYPGMGTKSLEAIGYCGLAAVGEAGEVANKIKKLLRDGDTPERRLAVRAEIGDTLWYLARLAVELDTSLNLIAQENLIKLEERKAKGTIGGEGDNR